ncbi:hypothetical protein Pmani_038211 [Petrolisthes manimaculis]|uniref:Uncharacterized protein n=1 Tax=Petrolisthes manimaculis TaxID=1843537 RepID=A0AAE1NGP0_9EUCA|nr:hypothetical protein Pmani_038211 [Petrolisthes manimaculis]
MKQLANKVTTMEQSWDLPKTCCREIHGNPSDEKSPGKGEVDGICPQIQENLGHHWPWQSDLNHLDVDNDIVIN